MKIYHLDDESLKKFKATLNQKDYIAVEASSNSFWFHDQVKDHVKECLVYDVNNEKNQGNKTDKIDACKLAKKLSYFICMGGNEVDFPTVFVRVFPASLCRYQF